jgi:hypothetical protein
VQFLLIPTCHIHEPEKLLKLHIYGDSHTVSSKGLKGVACCCSWSLWLLVPAGTRLAPDGCFCGGLPFILGCKQPEQLEDKWVIYHLLPKASSADSFTDIVTKGYQCAGAFDFCGHCRLEKKSHCLEHLHAGSHMPCKWVPASQLPQMWS